MERSLENLTVKELRKFASEQKIPGRSKMNKSQLFEALSSLTSQFDKMNLETKQTGIEKYLVEKMEMMSLEEEVPFPSHNPFGIETDIETDVNRFYDYVIVEFPSTEDAFPVLVDNPKGGKGAIKWNDFMYHFFGYTHKFEGVWVTTDALSGPIGLKAELNSPMSAHFEKYIDINGKKRLASATITPLVDPNTAGYKDILDRYGIYNPDLGAYKVIKVNEFCEEIIERSAYWDYIPPFVEDIERALSSKGIGFSNKVIFADVECKDLEELKEVSLDYPDYNDCRVTQYKHFETPNGLYIAYLKLE